MGAKLSFTISIRQVRRRKLKRGYIMADFIMQVAVKEDYIPEVKELLDHIHPRPADIPPAQWYAGKWLIQYLKDRLEDFNRHKQIEPLQEQIDSIMVADINVDNIFVE